ncbi:MAG TPA: ABC transporter permease [Actinomycetes bacterium]|nr:ABC transporter permease [Actinomycetes bacterium]
MKVVGRLQLVLLSAYFWLFVAFLIAPLVVLVVFAFNDSTTPTLPLAGFTTDWFSQAFSNTQLTTALVRSTLIAIVTGLLATGLGMMAAIGLSAERMRLRSLVIATLLLPLVVPYISLAVGLVILLQALQVQTSLAAVVLGHVVIALPFAILVLLPRLRTLDASMLEAARDLGSSSLTAFRLITLPLLGPALVSSFLICFVTSFDEFAIASFVAPSGEPTYPVFLYASARTPALLPQVIAIGTLVIAGSIILVLMAESGRRRVERRLVGEMTSPEQVHESGDREEATWQAVR